MIMLATLPLELLTGFVSCAAFGVRTPSHDGGLRSVPNMLKLRREPVPFDSDWSLK